jgi:hypothetical protein
VRPQAWKNRRCIRWNTLRISSGRERDRWSRIVRRSRKVNVGQAPRRHRCNEISHDAGVGKLTRSMTRAIQKEEIIMQAFMNNPG